MVSLKRRTDTFLVIMAQIITKLEIFMGAQVPTLPTLLLYAKILKAWDFLRVIYYPKTNKKFAFRLFVSIGWA